MSLAISPAERSEGLPPRERFFEDFAVGEVFEFGDRRVEKNEIIEFARKYDPQPFHTDPVAAHFSAFGGLCASGWHSAAIVMRILVDKFISPASAMGSPGVDELRWVRPVRPGDRLRVSLRVLETRRSTSKPDRGVLKLRYDTFNQDGEKVMSITTRAMMRCRNAPGDQR
jgi:acyl dehydratase